MKVPNSHKATPEKAYLTKRILLSSAARAIREAAKEAMKTMGYVVIAKDGWVVKKYADGRIEQLSKLEVVKRSSKVILD